MLFNEQQNQSEQYRHKKDVNFLRYGTSIVISEHSRLSNRMFISPLETDLLGTFFVNSQRLWANEWRLKIT